jgi:aryl-alcohol dehydrogenase-like predicted oxidoreductase
MVSEAVTIAPGFTVSRIAKGHWQLAARHGAPYAREAAIDDMRRFVEAGITLFDGADHYVGVEQLIGEFRRRHPDHARRLRVSTKLVPDLESLPRLRRRDVEDIVDRSLARLGQERLDLVQFHWWDYRVPGYLDAMGWLEDSRAAGKVELIGTTNFDTARLSEIVASGVSVATTSCSIRCSITGPRTAWPRSARPMASGCSATGRWPVASSASAGWGRPNPGRRSPTARS